MTPSEAGEVIFGVLRHSSWPTNTTNYWHLPADHRTGFEKAAMALLDAYQRELLDPSRRDLAAEARAHLVFTTMMNGLDERNRLNAGPASGR